MKTTILFCLTNLLICFGANAQVSPIASSALDFNGAEFIAIPNNSSLNLQTSTTFEGWFKFCQEGVIFSKNYCNYNAGYYFGLNADGTVSFNMLKGSVCTSQSFNQTSSQAFSFNDWHHYAMIVEVTGGNTKVDVYMDNISNPVISEIANGFVVYNSTEPFRIASYRNINGSIGSFPIGQMQEFRVYNSALSLSDLGLQNPTVNPILRLEMQNGTGSNIINTGSNASLVSTLYNQNSIQTNAVYDINTLVSNCKAGIIDNGLSSFDSFSLYPNPANTILNIGLQLNNILKGSVIKIMNISGAQLKEINVIGDKKIISTDISDLQSGIYFVSLIDINGQSKSIKFIKN